MATSRTRQHGGGTGGQGSGGTGGQGSGGTGGQGSGGTGGQGSGGTGGQGSGGTGGQGSGGTGGQGSGGTGGQGSGGTGGQGSGGTGGQGSGGTGGQGSGGTGGQGSGGTGGQGSGGTGGQGSGGPTSERQPLGELLSVDMELAGLQGQPMLLSWSIFQEGGQSHMSRNWLGNFAAYRLEATTSDDSGTLEMWIPLPRQPGPYFVRLTIATTGGVSLASMDSGPFG